MTAIPGTSKRSAPDHSDGVQALYQCIGGLPDKWKKLRSEDHIETSS